MKKALSVLLVLAFAFALCGFSTDFTVTGAFVSDGEEDETVANSYAIVSVDTDSTPAVFNVDLYIAGSEEPFRVIMTADDEGFGFSFPGMDDNYYVISWDALKDGVDDVVPVDLDTFSVDSLPTDEIGEIVSRYVSICTGLVTDENMTVEEGVYELPYLEETVDCNVLTFCPSQADWEAFYKEFADTALADEQLHALLNSALNTAYASGQIEVTEEYASAEEFAAATLEEIDSFLTSLSEHPESAAEVVDGMTFTAGYTDDAFYGARLLMKGEVGGGYESFTFAAESEEEADVRYDAIVYYADGEARAILCNQLSSDDTGFYTYLYSDFMDFNVDAFVDFTEVSVLDLPTFQFCMNLEGMEVTFGEATDEGDAVFYFDLLPDENNELYVEARTDGSPTSVTAPTSEPVAVSNLDEVVDILSSIFAAV